MNGKIIKKRVAGKEIRDLKIALVIHPLMYWGGAQYHFKMLAKAFPQADIVTAWHDKEFTAKHFPDNKIVTSFLQWIPFRKQIAQELVPLQPYAYWSINMKEYDVVWVFSDGFDKVVRPHKDALHILQVMTPPRFLWLGTRSKPNLKKWTYWIYSTFLKAPLHAYWKWIDKRYAGKADYISSISNEVAERVKKYWGRDSDVLYPPVPLDQVKFNGDQDSREDWYVYFGAMETYKGVEIAIRACVKTGKKLRVYGSGGELENMKRLVVELGAEELITFYGRFEDEDKTEFLMKCRGAILPAKDEDFGITFVEAMAAGAPVIAYSGGGAKDILDDKAAVFMKEYSVDGIVGAVKELDVRLQEGKYDPGYAKNRAEQFSTQSFITNVKEYLDGISKR